MRFIFCFLLYGVCFSYSSRADNLNDVLRYKADSAFRYCKEHQLDYSLGCPVVSEALMQDLDTLLQKAANAVLLWIYFDLYEPF